MKKLLENGIIHMMDEFIKLIKPDVLILFKPPISL